MKNGIASPGAVLIASGSLGDPAYTWTWALNLKTLQATLTGTEDGVTFIQGNFPFTFTHGGDRARTGLPSAVVTTLTAARH